MTLACRAGMWHPERYQAIVEDKSTMLILGCKRRRPQEPIFRKLQAAGDGERRLELAGRLAMQATVVTDQGIRIQRGLLLKLTNGLGGQLSMGAPN